MRFPRRLLINGDSSPLEYFLDISAHINVNKTWADLNLQIKINVEPSSYVQNVNFAESFTLNDS